MKKLFFIALILISFQGIGQVYQAMPQAGYGPVKRFLIDSVLTIPMGKITLRNITGGRDTAQIRYNIADSSMYVYSGYQWIKLGSGTSGWGLTGNASTVAGTNFIGTTDAVGFDIRTNNTIRQSITSGGNVGIGTTSPVSKLHVTGAIRGTDSLVLTGLTSSAGTKALRYNTSTGSVSYADTLVSLTNGSVGYGNGGVLTGGNKLTFDGQVFNVNDNAGNRMLSVDNVNRTFYAGDIDGGYNTSYYSLDDVTETAIVAARNINLNASTRLYVSGVAGIGTTPDASAQLEVGSSSKGFLIPRMTTTGRNAIPSPATGLLIWNTTDSTLNQYRGLSGWAAIGSTYSAGYGLSLATTTFSADTAIVSTKAWRQKGVDSVVGLLGSYLPLAGATYSTTSGDGLALTTSTLTTGNLMKLTNTSTVNNGAGLLSIVSSGANSTASKTTYGQQISVTNTGTTSTNVGLLVTTSGGTNNYAALFTGNVGIGVTTPINTLDVVRGTAGTMTKGTYETASFERNADMKFGIYTSSASSADGASLAFGQTNLKANSNTVYPGFEMQYSYSATPETNKMVWNYLGRNASGSVTNYGTEIIKLYASGLVAINYASSAGVTVESKLAVGANSAAASSIVDITSTTKGLLIPRMTTTQMNAISSPATGLQVYNTTTSSNNLYDGTGWKQNATLGYVDKSANYTILTTDEIINCTTAAITITLPTAVGASGKNYTIINSTSGDVTINTTSSQTIGNLNTATSLTLANDKSVILVSSNAAWKIKAIY